MRIKAGIRPSKLALCQAEELKGRFPEISFDVITIETGGDKDKTTPLTFRENSDFFTREIEEALLTGDIDIAVHSAKDMEEEMPEGLVIAATTRSVSGADSLVSRGALKLDELPAGSVIGTSSAGRRDGIKRYRDDLVVRDIRGNVDERIAKMDRGEYDAIIVAHAALIRLGLEDRSAGIIPSEIIEPHPLQGRLAIQVRKDRTELIKIFGEIDGK